MKISFQSKTLNIRSSFEEDYNHFMNSGSKTVSTQNMILKQGFTEFMASNSNCLNPLSQNELNKLEQVEKIEYTPFRTTQMFDMLENFDKNNLPLMTNGAPKFLTHSNMHLFQDQHSFDSQRKPSINRLPQRLSLQRHQTQTYPNIPEEEVISFIIKTNSTTQNDNQYLDITKHQYSLCTSLASRPQKLLRCKSAPQALRMHIQEKQFIDFMQNMNCKIEKVRMPDMPHLYQDHVQIEDSSIFNYSLSQLKNECAEGTLSDFPKNINNTISFNAISIQQSPHQSSSINISQQNRSLIQLHSDELIIIIKEYLDKLSFAKIQNELIHRSFDDSSLKIQNFDEIYMQNEELMMINDTLQKIIKRTFEQLKFTQNNIALSPINDMRNHPFTPKVQQFTYVENNSISQFHEQSMDYMNSGKHENLEQTHLDIEQQYKQEVETLKKEIEVFQIKRDIADCRMMEYYDNEQKAKKRDQLYLIEIKELKSQIESMDKSINESQIKLQVKTYEVIQFQEKISCFKMNIQDLQQQSIQQTIKTEEIMKDQTKQYINRSHQMNIDQKIQLELKSNIENQQIVTLKQQLEYANTQCESLKRVCTSKQIQQATQGENLKQIQDSSIHEEKLIHIAESSRLIKKRALSTDLLPTQLVESQAQKQQNRSQKEVVNLPHTQIINVTAQLERSLRKIKTSLNCSSPHLTHGLISCSKENLYQDDQREAFKGIKEGQNQRFKKTYRTGNHQKVYEISTSINDSNSKIHSRRQDLCYSINHSKRSQIHEGSHSSPIKNLKSLIDDIKKSNLIGSQIKPSSKQIDCLKIQPIYCDYQQNKSEDNKFQSVRKYGSDNLMNYQLHNCSQTALKQLLSEQLNSYKDRGETKSPKQVLSSSKSNNSPV